MSENAAAKRSEKQNSLQAAFKKYNKYFGCC